MWPVTGMYCHWPHQFGRVSLGCTALAAARLVRPLASRSRPHSPATRPRSVASSGALADREVPHPPSPATSNACLFLAPKLMRPVEHSR